MYTLLLFILFLLFLFGSYKPTGYLGCGLFGGGFNRPLDELIINKIKILGFMNQSRGEHSCGYFNGENLFKGVDAKKKFIDLVNKDGIQFPENPQNRIFLGHTRHATYGSHTEGNAHPFNVDDKIIMAHNGTISNIWELCTRHGVAHNGIFVDSLGLGHLLAKVGYKILEEYKGYAALLVHRIDEPNSLYCYHGASKDTKDGEAYEERPMFYLETEEGTYISSLDYALQYIKRPGEEVKILPHNRIFRIHDGVMQKTKITIERGECNVKYIPPKTTNYWEGHGSYPVSSRTLPPSQTDYNVKTVISDLQKKFKNVHILGGPKTQTGASPKQKTNNTVSSTGTVSNTTDGIDIMDEYLPPESLGLGQCAPGTTRIYYRYGRHWIVCKNPLKQGLAEGSILINTKTGDVVPVITDDMKGDKVEQFYFYKGVMLDSKKSWDVINEAIYGQEGMRPGSRAQSIKVNLTTDSTNFANAISMYSKYPVCLIKTSTIDESPKITQDRKRWYKDGKYAQSAYTPKFSSRDYHYQDGLLIRIRSTSDNDKMIIKSLVNKKEVVVDSETEVTQTTVPFPSDSNAPRKKRGSYEDVDESEIKKVSTLFRQGYSKVTDATDALGDVGMCAFGLYIEDLYTEILHIANPTDDQVESLVLETIKESVEQKCTLEQIMAGGLSSVEDYVRDAIATVEEDSSHETEEVDEDEGNITAKELHDEDEKREAIVNSIKQGKIVPMVNDVTFRKLNQSSYGMDLNDPDEEDSDDVKKKPVTQLTTQ